MERKSIGVTGRCFSVFISGTFSFRNPSALFFSFLFSFLEKEWKTLKVFLHFLSRPIILPLLRKLREREKVKGKPHFRFPPDTHLTFQNEDECAVGKVKGGRERKSTFPKSSSRVAEKPFCRNALSTELVTSSEGENSFFSERSRESLMRSPCLCSS